MPLTWKQAVWSAVQRQAARGDTITRQGLIDAELAQIVADVGSTGATPAQTLSRILQELRDDGVLIFDAKGQYRLASEARVASLEEAIATQVRQLQWVRLGQSRFRAALDARWGGACPLTGVADRALLRASHIVPWNRCEDEAERLEPDNGLLLSALWDAAFDKLLVSFGDDGVAVASPRLSARGRDVLRAAGGERIAGLTAGNVERLRWHRALVLG
ncbi:MAG: HNH endonuclease [Polymorphobacter sp.]|uniref:HNH endonuclease n=1 Tax=Polymorphobacter sp. TaxID=1909290 RepID=UPI003A843DF5